MFLETKNSWQPPERPEERRAPRLDARAQSVLAWIVAANLLMLLFGPLAGATLFDAARAVFASLP